MTSSHESDYVRRFYRDWLSDSDLYRFRVAVGESDLQISVSRGELLFEEADGPDISGLREAVVEELMRVRRSLRTYIERYPEFLTSLRPIEVADDAPPVVQDMASAASLAGVGPMAAVAGAIAHSVGAMLANSFTDVIVENGGDLFVQSASSRVIGVYCGRNSKLTGRLALRLDADRFPVGVCTSAGTVGPSLSFGSADAVTVVSKRPSLADAAATAIGNQVKSIEDIPRALEFASGIHGVEGVIVVKDDKLGVWGQVELV